MAEVVPSEVPGAAVALVRNGVPIFARGYGFANLEWGAAVGPDTVFRLGSVTKPFTACAILLLEAARRLRLDDPLGEHLPDYPAPGRDATLRQILHHASGIPNYTAPRAHASLTLQARTPGELVAAFRHLPLDFTPGTDFRYSNSGYTLLGQVIESRSGQPYAEFVRDHIFTRLGMAHSLYLADEPLVPGRAAGYARAGGGYVNAPHLDMRLPFAAGGLGSTLSDLVRFDTALRRGEWLDREMQIRMAEPLVLADGFRVDYGLGWRLTKYRGARVLYHAGHINGFSAFLARCLDGDLTVIVLTNGDHFGLAPVVRRLADSALGHRRTPAVPVSCDRTVLERVAGTYADDAALSTLEVMGTGLNLQSPTLATRLVPAGEAVFRAADDADIEVRFEGRHMVIDQPFFWSRWLRVR